MTFTNTSVHFSSQEELDAVKAAAAHVGKKYTAFIREAAISAAQNVARRAAKKALKGK